MYKSFVQSELYKIMETKERQLLELKEQRDYLKNQLKSIEKKLVDQESLAIDLKHKIIRWQEHVTQESHTHTKIHEQHIQNLVQKKNIQSKQFQLDRLQREVFPQAVGDLKVRLEQEFAHDKQQGKEYVRSILMYMQRDVI